MGMAAPTPRSAPKKRHRSRFHSSVAAISAGPPRWRARVMARRGEPGAPAARRRDTAGAACQRVSAALGRGDPRRSSSVNTPLAAAANCRRRVTVRSMAGASVPLSSTTPASAPQRCASAAARSMGSTPPADTSHSRAGSPPSSAMPSPFNRPSSLRPEQIHRIGPSRGDASISINARAIDAGP